MLRATLRLVCREAGVPWSRHLGSGRGKSNCRAAQTGCVSLGPSRKRKEPDLLLGPGRLCLIGVGKEKQTLDEAEGYLRISCARHFGAKPSEDRKKPKRSNLSAAQGSCASLGPAKDRKKPKRVKIICDPDNYVSLGPRGEGKAKRVKLVRGQDIHVVLGPARQPKAKLRLDRGHLCHIGRPRAREQNESKHFLDRG